MLTSCWGVIATAANIPDGTNPDYTVDDYRADMPALADSLPEHLLAEYVQMAHSVVREARWHGYWRQGMRLFISHFAALYAAATPSDGDTASIAAASASGGMISGETVGSVSVSFDNSTYTGDLAGWAGWKDTEYGVQFATLARMLGKGGMWIR